MLVISSLAALASVLAVLTSARLVAAAVPDSANSSQGAAENVPAGADSAADTRGVPAAPSPPQTAPADAVVAPDVVPDVTARPVASSPSEVLPAASKVPAEADASSPAEPKRKKGKKHLGLEGQFGRFDLSGRAFLSLQLAEATRQRADAEGNVTSSRVPVADIELGSTRLRLDWQSPVSWLSGRVSVGLNPTRVETKDAFFQAKGAGFLGRAGQFKLPTSPFDTGSAWALPMGRHDAFSNLLSDALSWERRRPGLLLGFELGALPIRLDFGMFQSAAPTGTDGTVPFVDGSLISHLLLVTRVEFDPGSVKVGAWGAHRKQAQFASDEPKSYFTAGMDVTAELEFAGSALRLWADGIGGNSWITVSDKPSHVGQANYVQGRLLAAYRWGGLERDAFYVEPFGLFGVLDPDLQVRADLGYEAVLGVNVGLWKRVRASIQGESGHLQQNAPEAYRALGAANRKQLLLQVGAAF